MRRILLVLLAVVLLVGYAYGEEVVITMYEATKEGPGKRIGTIKASDSVHGLILRPQLTGLSPGIHGFHLHQNPDCNSAVKDGEIVPALAAGGHFDPAGTNRHEGPYDSGHLGDLPALYVGQDGTSEIPVLAPRLKVSDLKERSLVIHAGGDNYSDMPHKLGGGGGRVACGVIR